MVVHVPQADRDGGRTGIQERLNESCEAFPTHRFPETGLARRKHHQIGVQLEIEDFVYLQETILGSLARLRCRTAEKQSRQLRPVLVDQAVYREMNESKVIECPIPDVLLRGILAEKNLNRGGRIQ